MVCHSDLLIANNVKLSLSERRIARLCPGERGVRCLTRREFWGLPIHEALLETDERGVVESIATRYLRECRLMLHMRHPNITQFVGISFKAG